MEWKEKKKTWTNVWMCNPNKKKRKTGAPTKSLLKRQNNNQSDPNKQRIGEVPIRNQLKDCVFSSLFYYYLMFFSLSFFPSRCRLCKNMRYVLMAGIHWFFIHILRTIATTNYQIIDMESTLWTPLHRIHNPQSIY